MNADDRLRNLPSLCTVPPLPCILPHSVRIRLMDFTPFAPGLVVASDNRDVAALERSYRGNDFALALIATAKIQRTERSSVFTTTSHSCLRVGSKINGPWRIVLRYVGERSGIGAPDAGQLGKAVIAAFQ